MDSRLRDAAMNILVTNDDGWGAEGIQQLAAIAAELGTVTVVAPARPQSGISHQLTLDRAMTLVEKARRSFALDGTPADCVRYGLSQLSQSFDLVLSGINHGANLGVDVFVSGTVAAAREATFHGVSSIALSQYRTRMSDPHFAWQRSGNWCRQLLSELVPPLLEQENGQFSLTPKLINVNLPDGVGDDLPEVVHCSTDQLPLPTDYAQDAGQVQFSGRYQDRPQTAGCDIEICFGGKIAVSRLS